METTPTPIYDNLVITQLEESLKDETGCEFNHSKTMCSGEVTHRIIACTHSVMVCTSAATVKKLQVALHPIDCARCNQPAINCWKILPV